MLMHDDYGRSTQHAYAWWYWQLLSMLTHDGHGNPTIIVVMAALVRFFKNLLTLICGHQVEIHT